MGRLTSRDKHEEGFWVKEEGGNSTFFEPYDEGYLAISKLAHYEDMEEQGRLIELPCALNTKVYYIGQDYKGINEVHSMQLFTYDLCINTGKGIGEWLYLTKEEAEAKLKELQPLPVLHGNTLPNSKEEAMERLGLESNKLKELEG